MGALTAASFLYRRDHKVLALVGDTVADSVQGVHEGIRDCKYGDERPEASVQDADRIFEKAPGCQRGLSAVSHLSSFLLTG